jgi:NADPH2:quinone reductase
MRAIVIARFGGPDVLELREVPRPVPGLHEVLVRVHAAALNRADILQREGRYPAPPGAPADIPGLEFAGEVALAGPGAARWPVGARVFGIVGGGAYAEYLTVHEDAIAPVPSTLGWIAAASVPEAFITAHDALRQAEMRVGDLVLIHAVGSGVGLAAVQLVRAMGGIAIGTARHEAKLEAARALGMVSGMVVGPAPADFGAALAEATGGGGVNVVLDLLGGSYTAASVSAMAPRGRLILIGTLAGPRTDLPLHPVLRGRLTIKGTVLRARSLEEKIAATRAFEQEVVPMLERGTLKSVVDSTFPLDEAGAAHERMASNATVGKVVLRVER